MRSTRTSATATALTFVAVLGLSACGGSDDKPAPTAKDAWNKAQDTLGTYTSLKMVADGKDGDKDIHMDVEGAVDGKSQRVTGKQGSGTFEMITTGGKSYMKGNTAYYESSSKGSNDATDKAMTKKMADRWVEVPQNGSSNDTALLKGFIKDMRDDSDEDSKKLLSDKATVTKDSVDGTDAWKITSEDKKLSVWVSQDDKRDLLKASGLSGSSKNSMSSIVFSDPNKTFDIQKPDGAKSISEIMFGK